MTRSAASSEAGTPTTGVGRVRRDGRRTGARQSALVEQGQQTREALLDVAIDLFGQYGYRGCSLAQVAKEAGVVQSALLYHFGSKEQLLMTALLDHYPITSDRPIATAIASGQSSFGDELLRATIASMRNPALIRFFSVMAGESLTATHPAHDYFTQRYDANREQFATAVLGGLGLTGPSTRAEVERLLTTAFATVDGLQAQWLRNPGLDLVDGVRRAGASFDDAVTRLR